MTNRILIVAGDVSADLHGAALAQALKKQETGMEVWAMGGSRLQSMSDRFVYPLASVGGFGFWEPALKLPSLWKAWRAFTQALDECKPRVVIPMDFYGFNIHVAEKAHAAGAAVAYYISPQVWATRSKRIKRMARCVNKALVILPFEEELYRKSGMDVAFVGHPLLDWIPPPSERLSSPSPSPLPGRVTIGLLPGSRLGVVKRHLPILLETAEELRNRLGDGEFYLFAPENLGDDLYRSYLQDYPWIPLVRDPQYERRRQLSLALSVSGTAALENALLGIPMVIFYRLSALTYRLAKRLARVPYIAMPNLLAHKPIVPELIQDQATPENLAAAAQLLLEDPSAREGMRRALLALRPMLGEPGVAERAAREVLAL